MFCWKCGAENDDGYVRCRACLTPARKPGLLGRLLSFFGGAAVRITPRRTTRTYRTTSLNTHVADSLDDLPPEIRAHIEEARASGGDVAGSHTAETMTFSYTDASGRTRTYHSVDEMPADVRAIYDRIREQRR